MINGFGCKLLINIRGISSNFLTSFKVEPVTECTTFELVSFVYFSATCAVIFSPGFCLSHR